MASNFKGKQKKNPLRSFLLLLGGIVILGAIVMLIVANAKMYHREKVLLSQEESLKNKIKETQDKNASLKENIAKQNDSQYIEKVAREELDLQKNGETVVSFVAQTPAPKQENTQKNFLQIWLGYVSNWFKR